MKKYLFAILAAGVLVSCAKENVPAVTEEVTDEIVMSSGVDATTKAPVESDASDLPTINTNVWFVRSADQTAATIATSNWASDEGIVTLKTGGYGSGLVPAQISTAGAVTFTPTQYYHSDPSYYSYMIGFAPYTAGVLTKAATQKAKATWTYDGKMDLLVADAVGANKAIKKDVTPANRNLKPRFYHLLTWLDFKVVGATADAATNWGQVKSITIKNVNTKVEYTIEPFAAALTPNAATFSTNGNVSSYALSAAGVPSDAAPAALALSSTAQNFSYALVEPGKAAYDIDVVTSVDGADANNKTTTVANFAFAGGASAKAGYRHVVTLTFNSSDITAVATIKKWEDGEPGTGDVE